MNINPSCDVDNFSDFVKYYLKSYMPLRDGTGALYVAQNVEEGVVLVNSAPYEKEDLSYGWKVATFDDLKKRCVFSRINGRLLHHPDLGLLIAYMSRNRSTARGFRPENYCWLHPHVEEARGWRQVDAPHHFSPIRPNRLYSDLLASQPDKTWFLRDLSGGQSVIIDDKHSLQNYHPTHTVLYWLTTPIGTFRTEGGIVLHDNQKWRIQILNNLHAFKGVSIR